MKLPSDDKTVKLFQYAIFVVACLFVAGIIAWVAHLLSVSWELQDVPSASIGISIVAIPLFSTLFGIFSYVFWGLMRGGE